MVFEIVIIILYELLIESQVQKKCTGVPEHVKYIFLNCIFFLEALQRTFIDLSEYLKEYDSQL